MISREDPDRLPADVVQTLASSFGLVAAQQGLKPRNGAHYLAYRLTTSQGDYAVLRPRSHSSNESYEKNPLRELWRANRILAHLAHYKFPVAAPLRTIEGATTLTIHGEHYALYPYVRGRAMQRTSVRQVAKAGAALATYHRIMARSPQGMGRREQSFPERFQERLDIFCENVASLNGLLSNLGIKASLDYFNESLSEIEKSVLRLSYENLPRLIIHGDYRRQNILFHGERIAAVMDFHRSRSEARSLDLAIALADIVPRVENGHGINLARTFVTGYRRLGSLSEDEMEALPALVEARVAWRVFRRVRRIVKARDNRKRLRGARRLRMYVAHLRRVRMIQSSWKRVSEGATGE